MAVVILMATAAILLVPNEDVDGDAFTNIDGDKNIIEVGKDGKFNIIYRNNDYNGYQDLSMSITYDAVLKGSDGSEQSSSSISPSSGDLDNGIAKELTVTAPKTAGTYTLEVTFEIEGTYTDDEGETQNIDEKPITKTYIIKAVNPIKLSISLKNDSDIDLSGFGVYFYINGEKVEDSYQTIDLNKAGSTTVTYNWITDAGNGKYSFYVAPADGGNLIEVKGLGDEHTFYIGDNSYTTYIVLAVVLIILLIVIMVWVYRKPVKNYGKPKSRR